MYNSPENYVKYNGETIYKITIEAGCQLPCGDVVYTTTETVTYVNQDYGNATAKYIERHTISTTRHIPGTPKCGL